MSLTGESRSAGLTIEHVVLGTPRTQDLNEFKRLFGIGIVYLTHAPDTIE